ncbi:hypothetical protein Tco_0388193, partial [Tanacetum coccineum]
MDILNNNSAVLNNNSAVLNRSFNFLSPFESCQKDMVMLRIEETWMIVLDTAELRRLTL